MTSPFKYFKTGYSVEQIPDLSGKIAIVTGGNTGLGYETVLQLAKKGARVYMATRSPERAEAALAKLKTDLGSEEAAARVEFLQLDLQDLKQVKSAAETFLKKDLPLHILVNNAGIMACPFGLTKDGIESQLGTNHVGHFAFTMALLPALEKETPSRVVNVSSTAHRWAPEGGILFEKLTDEEAMSTWERYGQSKLANILFTREFDKRYGEKKIITNAVHPGGVRTELERGPIASYGLDQGFASLFAPVLRLLAYFLMLDPKDGALTQIYVATSPDIEEKGFRAKYFIPFAYQTDETTEAAKDDALAAKLWDWTEGIVKEKLSS